MRKKALGLRWWNHGPGAIFAQVILKFSGKVNSLDCSYNSNYDIGCI